MSRKNRYIPVPKRVEILADLVELNNTDSLNTIDIVRYNALEEALAILESREPVLKEVKTNWIDWIKFKIGQVLV